MSHLREAGAGALLGVATATAVSLLRVAQLPDATGPMDLALSGSGVALWILLGAAPGAVVGLLGAASAASPSGSPRVAAAARAADSRR